MNPIKKSHITVEKRNIYIYILRTMYLSFTLWKTYYTKETITMFWYSFRGVKTNLNVCI